MSMFLLCVLFMIAVELADRYNTALVCHRWQFLACHPRLWLRVDRSVKDLSDPGVFPSVETAVAAARFVLIAYLVLISLFRSYIWKIDWDYGPQICADLGTPF